MHRKSIWLFVAVSTFGLGLAAAMFWFQLSGPAVAHQKERPSPPCDSQVFLESNADLSAASNLPILDYCELANNPGRYSGKIVRVRARLSGFIHGATLTDENCVSIDNQAAVSYNRAKAQEIKRTLDMARGSTDSMNWLETVNIIAVGKFEKVIPSKVSDAVYDTASLRFEIIRVEKASKLR